MRVVTTIGDAYADADVLRAHPSTVHKPGYRQCIQPWASVSSLSSNSPQPAVCPSIANIHGPYSDGYSSPVLHADEPKATRQPCGYVETRFSPVGGSVPLCPRVPPELASRAAADGLAPSCEGSGRRVPHFRRPCTAPDDSIGALKRELALGGRARRDRRERVYGYVSRACVVSPGSRCHTAARSAWHTASLRPHTMQRNAADRTGPLA
ncbi:hypothetical protein C8Q77DRAFT_16934 [Trametes polyzona]|nr:hypothetical protein C8Q77DRAFT_16934 [Trametes polyzona]